MHFYVACTSKKTKEVQAQPGGNNVLNNSICELKCKL